MADLNQQNLDGVDNANELTQLVQNMLNQMQQRFQNMSDNIVSRIDDMGKRIDELEASIADLVNEAQNDPDVANNQRPGAGAIANQNLIDCYEHVKSQSNGQKPDANLLQKCEPFKREIQEVLISDRLVMSELIKQRLIILKRISHTFKAVPAEPSLY
ncbi:hsbp1-like protein [Stylonychia lemnae]|uniref:Hsbp1-like protein n=1 Tax=Stylonychia lemnae TaxID=5949 RepID=A0A078B8I9_STYLE|nr:hsbp1-like protein [Stylonychia lemnae]|eukprot:CDW90511.1 hsbp1-like protein [Stylonychia lemnae]